MPRAADLFLNVSIVSMPEPAEGMTVEPARPEAKGGMPGTQSAATPPGMNEAVSGKPRYDVQHTFGGLLAGDSRTASARLAAGHQELIGA
jgi:hypothetical protein